MKTKRLQQFTLDTWQDILIEQSPLLNEVLESEVKCDDFMVQLGAAVRGHGVLATGSPSLRIEILELFERHATQLCAAVETNRLRMVYETLRDHLGSPARDGPKTAAQLRDAAIKSLNNVIIAVDAPRRDPRLLKFHVELLFKLLTGAGGGGAPLAGSAVQDALHDRRALAAECLQSLETAFPTLLAAEAAALVQLAAKEAVTPTPGFYTTRLASTVVSNLAATYLKQQEDFTRGSCDLDGLYSSLAASDVLSSLDSDDNDTEDVLAAAADVLCAPGGVISSLTATADAGAYDDDDGTTVDFPSPTAAAPITPAAPGDRPGSANTPESGDTIAASSGKAGKATSFSGAATVADSPVAVSYAASSAPSKQSSRRSMLAAVMESEEAESSESAAAAAALPLQRSALTFAIRRSASVESSDAGGIAWTAASSPRSCAPEVVILRKIGVSTELKRFSVPMHLQGAAACAPPRLVMNVEAQAALQDAAMTFLGALRRLDPASVAVMTKALPAVLRAARPSPTQLWPLFERQLSTGSTPLLRAVLELHDSLPELFEGRAPSLVEKVLCQVNDASLSADHRVTAASWVLRQHAANQHTGGALHLADSWELLLPRPAEPPQLAAVKVKALGACLSAGVGDEEVVCRSVCSWDGFGGARPSEQQLRALTYALRILHAAPPRDGPAAHRTHACLVAGALEAVVARPQLVPAVAAFVDTCPPAFAATFLRAFNAMLSGVDGQFEALRERAEDAPFQGTTADLTERVKAAVLSRSSSLSGLMRGLSFRLSFAKRTHSVLPQSTRAGTPLTARTLSMASAASTTQQQQHHTINNLGAPAAGTPRGPPVDVRALRSSINAAFQQPQRRNSYAPAAGAAAPSLPRSYAPSSIAGESETAASGGGYHPAPPAADYSDVVVAPPAAPTVPLELPTQEAAEAWLSSTTTWESLAGGMLAHDLLAYRLLMQRSLRTLDVHPRGTLRTLANYTWQYKESHPSHALPAKDAAAAILALCHSAALVHLPHADGCGWSLRQSELADAVQSVLDALEEGFPVPEIRPRCQQIARMVAEEAVWGAEARWATASALLAGYIDASVQG